MLQEWLNLPEHRRGNFAERYSHSVQQTSDGGYIIVGKTSSYGAGGFDIYLIKTDEYGDTVWEKTFGGSEYEYFGMFSVRQTSDGGYIIAGDTNSYGAGNTDFYLIKTDSDGNTLWEKTYGGKDTEYCYSVQTSGDGYIITGRTDSYGAGNADVYLIKTDGNGNVLWEKTFGGQNGDEGHSVQQTSDGGFIIAGMSYVNDAVRNNAYLIKTDTNGNSLWEKTFGGTGSNSAYSVQQTAEGGYIIVGYTTTSYVTGNIDVYLIKTDADGNALWEKTFGSTNKESGYSVQQTTEGGYIIAGYTDSYGAGSSDVYLIKTDGDGNVLWEKTFGRDYGDGGFSVQQTVDGGYVIAGYVNNCASCNPMIYPDVYLIKTDADGNVQ